MTKLRCHISISLDRLHVQEREMKRVAERPRTERGE